MKDEFISFMLEAGALLFGDFTLKSGRKSPYFINTGEFKTGTEMARLGDFYLKLVHNSVRPTECAGAVDEKLSEEALEDISNSIKSKFEVLFGPSYKGIPLAAMLSSKLAEVNRVSTWITYDRKERKSHGEEDSILCYRPQNGDRIAIVDDVLTAGTSVREVVELLKAQNIDAKVVALYIAIDRMEKGTGNIGAKRQIEQDYGIEVYSIATVYEVLEYLENTPANCVPVPDSTVHAKKMREYLEKYGAKEN